VKLAYFDQHSHRVLEATDAAGRERKLIDVVKEAASSIELDGSTLSASQLLERFLFPPAQQHQPVRKLSGGERRRLHLCRLLIKAPNVLLLDEPTNDLDVQTLTVLEDFLEDFRGCVVVVSHDRYFLDRTVDRLFCFENGTLQRFEGNYSRYLERCQQRTAAAAGSPPPLHDPDPGAAAPARPAAAEGAARRHRRSYKENRELAQLELNLPRWEEQRHALEQRVAQASRDRSRLEQLTAELAGLSERIDAAEERWLALSELEA
jgi:ATP-binding cassette subfamily F protein uup